MLNSVRSTLQLSFAFIVGLALVGCQSVEVKEAEQKAVIAAPISAETRPIALSKLVLKLDRGEVYGQVHGGVLCIPQPGGELKHRQGRVAVSNELFDEVFRETFEDAGYEVAGEPDNLFEQPASVQTDFLVGGLITELAANICWPWSGLGNWAETSGEAYVKVEWQIYNTLDRNVVARFVSEGSHAKDSSTDEPAEDIIVEAVASAITNLLAEQDFVDLLSSSVKESSMGLNSQPNGELRLNLKTISSLPFEENVEEIVKNVVTVRSSFGHGSGFFVSADGFLLTNHHVVGDADYVKVLMPDGRALIADVIRTNAQRDIALLKASEAKASGLALRTTNNNPKQGGTVYAVGSPLDENLDRTVSKGIISARRTLDGIPYFQSDVAVNPGNSGGALLNAEGEVIGVTVSGRTLNSVPVGVNFFIPIDDALRSLNIAAQ